MEYRNLGGTDVNVNLIGLGTMTWGEQNTEADAHAQLNTALDAGINLIDAAEMYPVPQRPETQGRTEAYIGTWLAANPGAREKIVPATKIAGPARQPHNPRHIRGAGNQFDRKNLTEAVDTSLARLQTDYVDLYQLHWPDRSTMTFGHADYPWVKDEYTVPIEETLKVLGDLVKAGKIRYVRGIERNTLGCLAIPSGRRQTRPAENCEHPESVQPGEPHVRNGALGIHAQGRRRPAGVFAAGVRWLSGSNEGGARPAGARITLFERFARVSHTRSRRSALTWNSPSVTA